MIRVHGGPGPAGPARWDFSTNANACGPCPVAWAAVQAADPGRYPDPTYAALRWDLSRFHGVDPARLVFVASASEAIVRLTTWAVRLGCRTVAVPTHAYGDYAHAAEAWGLSPPVLGAEADLCWLCDPSSPLGQGLDLAGAPRGTRLTVLDRAYAPLRLTPGTPAPAATLDTVWQMWTPNKALGLTGVRGAYLIAPAGAEGEAAALERLGPSWPLGAHAVAMLQAWSGDAAQQWLAASLDTLRAWTGTLRRSLGDQGWHCLPSDANFFCARPPQPLAPAVLAAHGVQLRDATSFGLPGHWRLGVLSPPAQAALLSASQAATGTPASADMTAPQAPSISTPHA
jgi:histidinol-phosphate aminotransferase